MATALFRNGKLHSLLLLIMNVLSSDSVESAGNIPLVINTWAFTNATAKAWKTVFTEGKSALDAVEAGCRQCQLDQCDFTVGYGGSPDENGETTLDAMIMDGRTHDVGAVAALRRVKDAIGVARMVLERTQHTLLVGSQATEFAVMMGFKEESLTTNVSTQMWKEWQSKNCQPNFWKNVEPDPKKSCGPYRPIHLPSVAYSEQSSSMFGPKNHDTIGIIVIDSQRNISVGTSSNGARNKIPGRVGDSPIPGAGAYVDQDVGAAAATGDGDIMMRLLPSYQTVENMRQGMTPSEASKAAMKRIVKKYPNFSGGLIAANANGEYGASCHGLQSFPFSVINSKMGTVSVKSISCV